MSSRYIGDRRGQRRGQQHADRRQQAEGASTLRKVAKRVRSPPSNRISASAIEPTT